MSGRGVEHGLDRFDNGGGIARRILAVDARREARLLDAGAQSSPSVAARSPRDTVESVVERTNTPRAGAVMVSTSSP